MEDGTLDLPVPLPAFNEEEVIPVVIRQIQDVLSRPDHQYEILVVDDGSEDQTAVLSKESGARVIRRPTNLGYGTSIKSGILAAKGKILLMMDADGQRPASMIPELLRAVGSYDMAVGARTKKSETSFHRDVANQIYSWLATYISGQRIQDLTSGFRAIIASAARSFVYLPPNSFSYPTTITLALLRSGRSLVYIPFERKSRVRKSKIKLIRDGIRFLLIIFRISTYYSPFMVFISLSILMFPLGFGDGLYKVIFLNTRHGPPSALLMTVSVLIFVVGLVSEQIAQLRYLWSERFHEAIHYND